ncbi:MAG: ATP-binding protein [Pseudobutyrivibrio sp.]|uniref:ATP-binding protein n=1 Tax=Pseudobutyrivibrio sp. TaxID=2014367 RepID=UPI0025E8AA4E|nr:AAA family ATPase [Pseudobutyrivibrio sp.]MBQ6462146.1 ATP-binding protein [Pseudobutyrivibrio sp.]
MLKRDIWYSLINWKENPHHPLVIKGLRQIGKTYIVKQFGKEFYESCVYIDLRADKNVHSAFDGNFDVDKMVMSISAAITSAKFIPKKTLIILDEIQDCPNARSSLKYWDIDGRYDVIATGSFLGVKGFREPYVRGIPVGYEEQITMYPLSFREFLTNTGINPDIITYIEKALKTHEIIEKTVHESIRSLYLQYLIVGGMPEAVNTFFDTHDLNAVRRIQQRIINSIKDDFGRYKDNEGNDRVNEVLKLRAEACLNSMPAQLSKEYKKFQYSLVNVKGHSPEKADGLQYLVDVGLVVRSYNTLEITFPLEGVKKASEFKAFFIDTGLLVSQLGDEVPQQILAGNLGSYKGAIAENMVASAFTVNGIGLYYFHTPSGSPELDFLFENNGETTIVECKSSNTRSTSMKFVLANPKRFGKHPAIKFADTNVGEGDGFYTYPLYAVGFIKRNTDSQIVTPVDVENLTVPVITE